MADSNWWDLVAVALGGGATVKIFDILYQEMRRRSDQSKSAKQFVDEHLDPLLKAADELVGKLRSLANQNFRSLHNVDPKAEEFGNHDFTSLLYLLARFWAYVDILRLESMTVAIKSDPRGERLQDFLICAESRKARIVDRISQRAVGELMLTHRNNGIEIISFIEFVDLIEKDLRTKRWVAPVAKFLSRTRHKSVRQRLLLYGVIIHAMIDTLDPGHKVTRDRPSYPDRLTKKTWHDLKLRVFGQYLKFVGTPTKYLGPPKKRRP